VSKELGATMRHSTAFEPDPRANLIDDFRKAIALRRLHSEPPLKAIAMSRLTWVEATDRFVTFGGEHVDRIFGVPVQFDETIGPNQFRPIYA
jgi:hypothetical protein